MSSTFHSVVCKCMPMWFHDQARWVASHSIHPPLDQSLFSISSLLSQNVAKYNFYPVVMLWSNQSVQSCLKYGLNVHQHNCRHRSPIYLFFDSYLMFMRDQLSLFSFCSFFLMAMYAQLRCNFTCSYTVAFMAPQLAQKNLAPLFIIVLG